ncbi:MAG: M56 family metallopeptidase [Planctomycetaceae bacterium]
MSASLSNAILVALLAVPVHVVCRWKQSPALTHALWLLLVLKLLTPPLVSVPLPWSIEVTSPEIAGWLGVGPQTLPGHLEGPRRTATDGSGQTVAAATELSLASHPSPGRSLTGLGETDWLAWLTQPNGLKLLMGLLAAWAFGSLCLASGVLRKACCFRRRLRLRSSSSQVLQAEVNRLSRELNLGRGPRAVFTDRPVSPMLWGVGPFVRLVFPRLLWERISDAERRLLLMHELGHFARRDPWVRLVEVLACLLFWWHPVVWMARRAIEQSGEECCDALVLHWQATPRRYAEAIVSTLDFLSERPIALPPLASGISDVPALKLRLTQIMKQTVQPVLSRRGRVVMVVWCLVSIVIHPFVPVLSARLVKTDTPQLANGRGSATSKDAEPSRTPAQLAVNVSEFPPPQHEAAGSAVSPNQPTVELPEVPSGWWSTADNPHWASSVSPNSRWRLVIQTGHRVRLESLERSRVQDLTAAQISAAAWLPEGNRFVTGSTSGKVQLWDAERGAPLSTLGRSGGEIRSIDIDPTGTFALTGGADGAVLIWELNSGTIVGAWRTPAEAAIVSVRYSLNGTEIGVAAGDWRAPGASRVLLLDATATEVLATLPIAASIAAIGFDQFDHFLVGDWSGQIGVWDQEQQSLVAGGQVSASQLASAAFSPQTNLARVVRESD